MIPLIAAIISTFKASTPLKTLLPGGIFQGSAPAGTTFDYLTINPIPSPVAGVYNGHSTGKLTVQFSIWTNKGGTVAGTIADAIILAFKTNAAAIVLSSGNIQNALLNTTPVCRPQLKKDPAGNTVILCPVDIKYSFEMGD